MAGVTFLFSVCIVQWALLALGWMTRGKSGWEMLPSVILLRSNDCSYWGISISRNSALAHEAFGCSIIVYY